MEEKIMELRFTTIQILVGIKPQIHYLYLLYGLIEWLLDTVLLKQSVVT